MNAPFCRALVQRGPPAPSGGGLGSCTQLVPAPPGGGGGNCIQLVPAPPGGGGGSCTQLVPAPLPAAAAAEPPAGALPFLLLPGYAGLFPGGAPGALAAYDGAFEPAFVHKRNERERHRVRCVNEGYARLRGHLPRALAERRLSKVETLRAAIRYIRHLQELLRAPGDAPRDAPPPAPEEPGQ